MNKSGQKWVEFLSRHFIYIMTVLALLSYGATYLEGCFGTEPIRSDGAGYYAYLPSYLVYCDPSFEQVAHHQYNGEIPRWTHIYRDTDTGRYLNVYNIGVAVLMLPFFLLADLLTFVFQSPPGGFAWWRFNYPLDGYSFFYQHAIGLAGVFYFIAGIALLKVVLERRFTKGVALATLVAITFGTSLFNFGTGETVMSHAYTFFLTAALLVLTPMYYEAPNRKPTVLLCGLVVGLLLLVRLLNVFYLLIPGLYGLSSLQDVKRRWAFLVQHSRSVVAVCGVALILFIPQLLIWKYAAGSLFVNPYREYFQFEGIRIVQVLFGVRKGAFIWFPILMLAFAGLFPLRKVASEYFWPVLVFLACYLCAVSSYFVWWGGGGFGNRYLADTFAVMSLPLAAFYSRAQTVRSRFLLGAVSACCVVFTLFLMKLYYTREIPDVGLDWNAFFDIFWLRAKWLLGILRPA